MPATKPRPGLPADIKFNPHNGARAELDADAVMARLEAGVTRRTAFNRLGGPRLYALYCAANPEWATRAEDLLARNAEAARWRKGHALKPKRPRSREQPKLGLRNADEVMARLEAGAAMQESIKGIGSHQGFQSQCEVDRTWGKKARRLLKRRPRKAPQRRTPRTPLSEGVKRRANGQRAELDAAAVMTRLEAGITRRNAFDGLGGPRLYALFCEANPEWAKCAEALLAKNAEAARWNKGAKLRDRTHCKRGHPFSDENNPVMVKREYGRMYYRTCRICIQERERNWPNRLTQEQSVMVIDAMKRNIGFTRLRQMVDSRRIYRERQLNPEFEAIVQRWLVNAGSRNRRSLSRSIEKRKYAQVDAVIPKSYPEHMRMEIMAMIFEALGQNKYRGKPFGLRNMADNIKYLVADYNKANPSHAYGKIDSPWSLDEAVPGTDGLRRIDTVSEGLW
jgi:hypothetical protein